MPQPDSETAAAGRDAREDLLVRLTRTPGQQTQISLDSTVERLYGRHLLALATQTARTLGLDEVRIELQDRGALDWVLQARLEAAALALDPSLSTEALPAMHPENSYSVERDRMRRSRLYLPGNTPDLMLGAGLFSPDGVILDLEDAVAPAHKHAARFLVRNALRAVDFGGAERMVRINQIPTGLSDLPFVLPHNVHTLLVPKAESAADVLAVVDRVQQLSPHRGVFLMPIIESALGVERAFEIASAHPWVVALAFGAEDFTRDIGAARTPQGRESFVARSRLVLAARAAGVQPIDTVFSDVADEQGLLAATREAIALGFDGKGCIHPRQIRVIHQAFRPGDEDVAYAWRVKQAMQEAEARGDGVIAIGSKMIDPPVVARARRVLELAAFYRLDPQQIAGEVGR
jgi:citrate lyase subunit beta/citryl-CoA lyase